MTPDTKSNFPLLYSTSSATACKNLSNTETHLARIALAATSDGVRNSLSDPPIAMLFRESLGGPGTLPSRVTLPALKPHPPKSLQSDKSISYKSPTHRKSLYSSTNLPLNWPKNLSFIEQITEDTLNRVPEFLVQNNESPRTKLQTNFIPDQSDEMKITSKRMQQVPRKGKKQKEREDLGRYSITRENYKIYSLVT